MCVDLVESESVPFSHQEARGIVRCWTARGRPRYLSLPPPLDWRSEWA